MELTRRGFIQIGAAALARVDRGNGEEVEVNDVHSQLNHTRVAEVVCPASIEELRTAVRRARLRGLPLSIAGSRHSMGGQQFGAGALLIDTRGLNRVIELDPTAAVVKTQAGIEWPELIAELQRLQAGREQQLGIIQKQTGADKLTLGGALSSNVHGRGLNLKPIIDNVAAFELMNAGGEILVCNRAQNTELFRLAIGGYGLFGVITSVSLQLAPRRKVRRVVEIRELEDIPEAFAARIRDGYLYGDFQFATDSSRDSFLRRGVFSCYQPVTPDTPLTQNPTRFHPNDWARLTYYSHKYKRRAFDAYTKRYLATSGQIYWADSQLSGAYVRNYHEDLDRKLHSKVKATEMITEIYVPRSSLVGFMDNAASMLREHRANVIYGTVRLIVKDDESFLRWAKESYACVIFNLHVTHDPAGIANAARSFRGLIDLGIRYGGNYYLTYHRFATKEQLETCYPQFRTFLEHKLRYDPDEMFQSDWYRHYKRELGKEVGHAFPPAHSKNFFA